MSKASATPSLKLWLALAVLVILLDQLTKLLIVGQYPLGWSQPVTHFFNLVRGHNTGAAFSFLASASGWQRWFFTGLGGVATPPSPVKNQRCQPEADAKKEKAAPVL